MTVAEIIDRAFARSKVLVPPGEPGASASYAELVPVVQDSLHALFQIAARVNPAYFGASEPVAYASGGWPRPDAAEAVEAIERADGERVVIVPRGQRTFAEPGFPCVYRWGRVYRPAGVTPGPEADETLTFFFSRVPEALVDENSTIDADYPRSHASLLECDVAVRAVIKDGGAAAEIAPAVVAERRDALRRYVAHLEHETLGVRWADGPTLPTPSLVSLEALLAGGA